MGGRSFYLIHVDEYAIVSQGGIDSAEQILLFSVGQVMD